MYFDILTKNVNNEIMDARKRQHVIEKAQEVFRRYGYARTTMADLATAAGLSRPALYLIFPNKQEVFNATVKWVSDSSLQAIREEAREEWSLEKKLLHTLEMSVAQAYDRVKADPDAEDLLSFNYEAHNIEPSLANLQGFLAELLLEAVNRSELTATPRDVARMLLASMRGFKVVATDGQDLRRLIALQISLIVGALGVRERRG